MANRPAQSSDWETEPLPVQHSRIDLDRTFTPDELDLIKRGVVPEEMEDKWFVYWKDR